MQFLEILLNAAYKFPYFVEMASFRTSKELLERDPSFANTLDSSAGGIPSSQLRSICSTPNSLEWDFKESTMSLQEEDEELWASNETEELLQEIEELAARALREGSPDLEATSKPKKPFSERR